MKPWGRLAPRAEWKSQEKSAALNEIAVIARTHPMLIGMPRTLEHSLHNQHIMGASTIKQLMLKRDIKSKLTDTIRGIGDGTP